jgi:hypothetical protein
MRRLRPSATAVGFDHRRRGCARSILAGTLLCLLGEVAQGAPAPGQARGPKRSPHPERQSPDRAAEKQMPKQPAVPLATDDAFNGCHKVPSGKRLVRVTVPTKTDLNQLIRWLSSVTCKSFVYATDDASSSGREVTIVAPTYVTPEDAFRLVLNSLDAVGLTLRPSGSYFQIIQSQYAHVTALPVYDYEGRPIREK